MDKFKTEETTNISFFYKQRPQRISQEGHNFLKKIASDL